MWSSSESALAALISTHKLTLAAVCYTEMKGFESPGKSPYSDPLPAVIHTLMSSNRLWKIFKLFCSFYDLQQSAVSLAVLS